MILVRICLYLVGLILSGMLGMAAGMFSQHPDLNWLAALCMGAAFAAGIVITGAVISSK